MDWVDEMMTALRAESPEAATVGLELAKRVGRLHILVEEAAQEGLSGFGITYAEFDVLATLRRSGSPYALRPSRLAKASMLSSGGTSNILQRLTTAGLVEREPDPADGRGSWVRLTDKGLRLAADVGTSMSAAYENLFGNVRDADARDLADRLRDVLITLGDVGGGGVR